MKPPRRLHWSLYFLAWTVGICVAGLVLGALSFPVVGMLVDTGLTGLELTRNGIRILGFYFSMWAPGVALVLTVKREYEARRDQGQRSA